MWDQPSNQHTWLTIHWTWAHPLLIQLRSPWTVGGHLPLTSSSLAHQCNDDTELCLHCIYFLKKLLHCYIVTSLIQGHCLVSKGPFTFRGCWEEFQRSPLVLNRYVTRSLKHQQECQSLICKTLATVGLLHISQASTFMTTKQTTRV